MYQADQTSGAFPVSATGRALIVDRKAESLRLHQAIRRRESLLICGPAGVGKTALISKVLAELPEDLARSAISVGGLVGLQPFLQALLQNLHEAGDSTLRKQLRAKGVGGGGFKSWLKSQSTSRLKGAVYRSMQLASYWVFLDHVPPPHARRGKSGQRIGLDAQYTGLSGGPGLRSGGSWTRCEYVLG
jgi:hypothetical protein